tara:strand:+ start:1075 stop:1980 length:906 start_codon:yes stop_codon:yes gene_type:complete
MKIITSTHYNRPTCTKLMLDHLAKCEGIEDYRVICCVEPVNNIIPDLIESHPLNTELVINERLLGLWENKKKALSLGFNESDYVIHVEDDILLSQDGLRFFEFCKQLKYDERLFSVCGFNRGNQPRPEEWLTDDAKRKVDMRQWYTPWGFATWFDRWKTFCSNWSGQDTSLNDTFRGERFEAYPILSRVQNIGALGGEYSSSQTRKDLDKIKTTLGGENIEYPREDLKGTSFVQCGGIYLATKPEEDSIYTKSSGEEVIKLNDNYVRTRHSPSYDSHHAHFWADDYNLENTDFYCEKGMGV